MFNFKLASATSTNGAATAATGTGNSIFNAMGLAGVTTSNGDRASIHAASGEELPAGWRLVSSRNSGKDYYLHIASGHTQWDKPTEAEPKRADGSVAKPTNVFSISGVARMGVGLTSMLNQANSRIQSTLQAKAAMAAPTNKSASRGPSDGGQHVLEMFENERLDGKLLASDPKKFSDRAAAAGSGYDDLPDNSPPDGHEWVSDWDLDQNYTSVDRDGWAYGADFADLTRLLNEESSHASRQPSDAVRRRRWVRYYSDRGSDAHPPSPSVSFDSSRSTGFGTASSWGNETVLDRGGASDNLFADYGEDDDPFHRTAQKAQTGFRVNMKFPHRGGKDNTKDYQSMNLTDVAWLVNDTDTTTAPTDEMMREKTANLEERIKEATKKSVTVEKELRVEHEKKSKELSQQQKKLDALISEYRKVQRENETLQISVSAHRSTVEALRKEATEKDVLLNEEQRALNAEMTAANQALEEKAKALATARMRYKRDNKSLATAVDDAKKRLEQQKAKAESDAQDPLSKDLKSEMERVRKLHAKLEAVRQHRLAIEEESKALFNLVVEKKADLKFQSKKKLETALKEVDEKIQSLKDEQASLTKKLAAKPDPNELRTLNFRRNDIRSELGALKERRTMLVAEKRKQDGSD
ncbi:hypothetical protein Poli38472_004564 [Pythium oligandrum]|uniref:WW domain-containing protein n=1 Tax=Pythium oligandrum TaxID=41045 RepID=A0A8K1CB02_PYTOL|nr:hypothetical protein Poli38472_004564 [Pythium oligandrum]|eukprot:TMW59495.1 hypothetical protein Poli38472_004564 [Pythium oligandrum]